MLTLPVVNGKKYVTRNGKVVTAATIFHCPSVMDLTGADGRTVATVFTDTGRGNGTLGINTRVDLVEDYVEPDLRPQWWIIYSPQGVRPPVVRQTSWENAWKEAERLAKANPGKDFYVMGPAAHYKSIAVTTVQVSSTIY